MRRRRTQNSGKLLVIFNVLCAGSQQEFQGSRFDDSVLSFETATAATVALKHEYWFSILVRQASSVEPSPIFPGVQIMRS